MEDARHVAIAALRLPLVELADGPPRNPDHHLEEAIAERLGIDREAVLDYRIERRSIDARRGRDPDLVYRLAARIRADATRAKGDGAAAADAVSAHPEHRLRHLTPRRPPRRPLVVGTGPAGLLAGLLLAEYGCEPVLVDRGRDAQRRGEDLERFHRERILDPDSNYLFGEGGAGAYSDGKLATGIKDDRIPYVLDALVAARAPRRIRYDARPHVGSDILPHVSARLRRRIENLGGSVRWGLRVREPLVRDGRCRGVILADGNALPAPAVILATGHSDRDLLRRLMAIGVDHAAKGYQIGCRIEHPQAVIDRGRYGRCFPRRLVGPADYRLVSRPPGGRVPAVASFCMCPGGEVLAATPDPAGLSTNGGSRYTRSSGWANAALIVARRNRDPAAAFARLETLEAAALAAGGGGFAAPAQPAGDFLDGVTGRRLRETSYRFGLRSARLDRLLPPEVAAGIAAALRFFERKLPGFIAHGQLIGVETRVSSPVRFARDERTLASSLPGLYLAGECAGRAGGIVSAAVDGLRIAEVLITSPDDP